MESELLCEKIFSAQHKINDPFNLKTTTSSNELKKRNVLLMKKKFKVNCSHMSTID